MQESLLGVLETHWGSPRFSTNFSSREEFLRRCQYLDEHYGAELSHLLTSAGGDDQVNCGMYRTALLWINRLGQAAHLDPLDVCHITWIRIVVEGELLRFREACTLRTWVQAILVNVVREEARRGKNVEPLLDEVGDPPNLGPAGVDLEDTQARSRIFFQNSIEEGRREIIRKGDLASCERAWILWNECLVDVYADMTTDIIRPKTRDEAFRMLVLGLADESDKPFPFPPPDVPARETGRNESGWTEYLARGIGVVCGWTDQQIELDLGKARSPRDLSLLRGRVRTRKNEVLQRLRRFLLQATATKPTKPGPCASKTGK